MTDDDHKQLKPRADNLPAALQRSKQLLALSANIRARTQSLATADDGWFERLCAWADEFDIPEEELPRDKAKLLAMTDLRIYRCHYINSDDDYPFRHYPKLTWLPTEISHLGNLQFLDLAYNSLSNLPSSIGKLKKLKKLSLAYNRPGIITVGEYKPIILPAEIGQLDSLQNLDLSHNCLTTLPVEIGQLGNLQFLNLQGNYSIDLPLEINKLYNLQTLNLSGNEYIFLPKGFGKLPNLKQLDLSYSWISDIDNFEELVFLENLQSLELTNNISGHIDDEDFIWSCICQLSNLRTLNLYGSDLPGFPIELCQITTLQELMGITVNSLPAEVSNLINLRTIELSYECIKNSIKEINKLYNLKEIYTYNINIEQLINIIKALHNIRHLYIRYFESSYFNSLSYLNNEMFDKLQELLCTQKENLSVTISIHLGCSRFERENAEYDNYEKYNEFLSRYNRINFNGDLLALIYPYSGDELWCDSWAYGGGGD